MKTRDLFTRGIGIFSERCRRWWLALSGLVCLFAFAFPAHAVPSFARQTGQSCVACHAGGQFPELTPYGRMFKLTGYTFGEQSNPLAMMLMVTNTNSPKDTNAAGNTIPMKGQTVLDFASIFLAGKISDNVGAFSQYTYSFYNSQDANGNWTGQLYADNFDLRYADRTVDTNRDLIWGLSLHNNPSVQDVWNSTPAWGYPYAAPGAPVYAVGGMPKATQIEGGLAAQVAGIGGYVYLNRHFYAELTSYQTAKGSFAFLGYPKDYGNSANAATNLDGNANYWRLAYTQDVGPHSFMVGTMGLDSKVYQNDSNGLPLVGQGSAHYQDVGVDAQYQYILSPHTVTAHFRTVQETIGNATVAGFNNNNNTLATTYAKASYIFRDRYGASLAYARVTGSADTSYSSNAGVPDTERWTPEVFWFPTQNTRVGLQFNTFTQYMGGTSNYAGTGRSASDNNATFLYLWLAF
jgi:hypothetical protein